MRGLLIAMGVASVATAGAGWAVAAVTILGGGMAEACSKAALAGRSDFASERLCDDALALEALPPTERAGTFINRGVMKLRRSAFEAAHADFDAGLALAPRIGDGWVNRGAMFVGERRYREAVADIDRGLALGVKEPEKAYYNRALAKEGLDDETGAYQDYQQALALKPGWDLPTKELLRFTVTRR